MLDSDGQLEVKSEIDKIQIEINKIVYDLYEVSKEAINRSS